MILVDTSIWIDHIRKSDAALAAALEAGEVLMHPFVLGELACGHLKNRTEVLRLLAELPASPAATNAEALYFIESKQLMGRGIGYIDVHLLAATALAGSAQLWTRDLRLHSAAVELGMAYKK
jgi:predicted nucleic acid-binding protein